ncbi:MAG: DUF697 domain-containing protein [Coriobacteriia bacterium]|nr:DUF697 domain-containing protein [Coriobacteriia bacterium]
MANLPIDVRALINTGSKLLEQRDLPVRIAVLVEIDAPDALLEAVRESFRPRTSKALVDVEVIEPGTVMRVDSSADAVIVLVGSGGADVGPTLADLRRHSIPTAAVAVRDEMGALPRLIEHPVDDVIIGLDASEILYGPLAEWVMRRLPSKHTAIAHNFEFVRRTVAREAVKATAWQNAAIGGLSIIPGTDMPIMTLNQGKMLLQIAAAYGQQLGAERVKELAAVVGGSFLFRAFARQALTLVPGFGWAIKAGVAYTGTLAMGNAAIAYFEQGADVPEMLAGLKASAEKAVSSAKGRLRRSEPKALPTGGYIELPATSVTVTSKDGGGDS